METNKKLFDSTVCFTFYGSWVEAIYRLETEEDTASPAYMLFKSIADYSMYEEEPNFDECKPEIKSTKAFWPLLEKEIDSSISRRKQGFKVEEPNKSQQRVLNLHRQYPNSSYRELALMAGVSKSMVGRIIQKYESMHIDDGAARENISDIGYENACAGDVDYCYDTDNAVDTDGIGTGQWDKGLPEDDGDLPF